MSTPQLVTDFYERLWRLGDRAALRDVLVEEVSFRGSLGAETIGVEAFWTYLSAVRAALAEYRCDVIACVCEEEAAFAKVLFGGIHVGEWRGFPPTGKRVEWLGAAHFVFRNGRISQIWVLGDLAGLDATLRRNDQTRNEAPAALPGAVPPRANEGTSK